MGDAATQVYKRLANSLSTRHALSYGVAMGWAVTYSGKYFIMHKSFAAMIPRKLYKSLERKIRRMYDKSAGSLGDQEFTKDTNKYFTMFGKTPNV